jgi:hypothetical protein
MIRSRQHPVIFWDVTPYSLEDRHQTFHRNLSTRQYHVTSKKIAILITNMMMVQNGVVSANTYNIDKCCTKVISSSRKLVVVVVVVVVTAMMTATVICNEVTIGSYKTLLC